MPTPTNTSPFSLKLKVMKSIQQLTLLFCTLLFNDAFG